MAIIVPRREFIRQATAASVILSAPGPLIQTNGSAAEKVVVGIMGTNGRGEALAQGFAKLPGAEVGYICDVDEQAIAKGLKAVQSGGQKKAPKTTGDFRQILDDKSVDALVIAAPDHWHAPAAILALKAGKNVYVEKPCSHNPREGEWLVEAAHKYKKVVQMGNQRRSWPKVVEAINMVKEGAIGRAYYAKAWYANTRVSIGHGKPAPVPAGFNFDLWQGPAPRRDYRDNIHPYNWHWFWHWGTGELLNNGTHFIDLCRWGLEVDYPTEVNSVGGRYAFEDDWETPDTQLTNFAFANRKSISWEGRSCNGRNIEGISGGVDFYGEKGTMAIQGNGYTLYDNKNKELKKVSGDSNQITASGPGFDMDVDHFANFRDAIRTGVRPVSSIEDANKSVLLCQLGNIAHRVGRSLSCDPATGRIKNDPEAMKLWGREYNPVWMPVV
ncbi:Gfo/Idh/MocA family protein [Spirosoma aerophilum]